MTQNYAIIVDDDPDVLKPLASVVRSYGYNVDVASSVDSARSLFHRQKPNFMLVDVMLPDGNGVEMIKELQADPSVKFVVITGQSSVEIVIESLRARVFDFLEKPVRLKNIRNVLDKLKATNAPSVVGLKNQQPDQILGECDSMKSLKKMISLVAESPASIWISGESGTGKELIAQQIHRQSGRSGEFVAVNCGAISKELGSSELFGHEKGSFTGATKRQIGHFERANGGTMLLDEITEMPLETQVYLLRALQGATIRRVGGTTEIPVDVRVIAASNRPADAAIKEGRLREDLYYRISEFPIVAPPLRERGTDVLIIARSILDELNEKYAAKKVFDQDAVEFIRNYAWHGNIRELKNAIHRAFLLAHSKITKDLFSVISNDVSEHTDSDALQKFVGKTFWEIEKEVLFATLEHYGNDKTSAAKSLGISLKTLYNRLNAYS